MTHHTLHNRGGVTLIEVLMAIVISAIAMFALVPPFLAEGNLFRKGKRQTEAQRDAQMALRAMARVARESTTYQIQPPGATTGDEIQFVPPIGGFVCFRGGPAFSFQFERGNACEDAPSFVPLIDGIRSRVVSVTFTQVTNKLVRVNLLVTHQLLTSNPLTDQETLETELFLRNGT